MTGYTIKKQSNGSGSWINTLDLASGTVTSIVPGEVFVVINADADDANLLAQADLTVVNVQPNYGAPLNFNGNDPVGLFKDDVLIDVIGYFDGGSQNFAKDMTLRRKSNITAPNTTYDPNEWEVFAASSGNGVYDGIGTHSTTLAVDDFKLDGFKMYPNPSNGNTIFFSVQQDAKVEIYSVLGRLVLKKEISQANNNLDISSLARGIYLVRIQSGNQFITKKLLKTN
ncbi:MAG: T9SS type A sorting domain-containing protein [Flavobacteriaceae bacterium]|nr:T9SS type A sorting domain-containing protein [Flavobacteriaceae bacterium]